MLFLKPSFSSHTGILRILLFISGFATLIDMQSNVFLHPEYEDFYTFRFAISLIAILFLSGSFFSLHVKKNLLYLFYLVALCIVIWLQLCIYYNQLNANYSIAIFVVFMGICLSFDNITHLRIYIAVFFVVTFVNIFQISGPIVSLDIVILPLLIVGFLSLTVFEGRIRLQNALNSQNTNFKAIADSIEESYFLLDKDFSILQFNKKSEEYAGLVWGRIPKPGDYFLDFAKINQTDSTFRSGLEKALSGENTVAKIEIEYPDRTRHWYQVRFLQIKGDDNKITGTLFATLNISQQIEVAERKRNIEAEIKKSQTQLNTVFESINLEIWTVDKHYEYVTFNEINKRNIRNYFNKDIILKSNALDYYPEELKNQLKSSFDKALEGIPDSFELKIKHTDGLENWNEYFVTPLQEDSQIIGALAIARDISEQKNALEAIRQSEYQFRNFFDFAPISMAIVSVRGEIIKTNQAFSKTFGYEQEDLKHKKFSDFSFPDDIDLNISLSIKLLKKELEFYELEKRYYHQNSQLIYAIIRVSLIKDAYDNPMNFLVQLVDITERKLNEEKIEDSERLLKSINQNLNDAIYRSTPENGIIYVNQAFVTLFGFESEEEVLVIPASSLYANPVDRDEIQRRIAQYGFFKNEEVLFRRKNGTTFWGLMSGNASHAETSGNFTVYDGAITDITELKRAEERLQRSRSTLKLKNIELQKINNELDRFVYITGHDLKAPLASVLGLINVMRLDMPELEDNQYLNMMEKSIHKLDTFIHEIIDYSKNARLEIVNEKIDFYQLITDTFEEIQFFDDSEHIDKIIEVKENGVFYGDKKRLVMIFNNLLSNAIRYHDKYKEYQFIKVNICIEENETIVEINDNGQGIEKSHLGKIFDMFYRASHNSSGSGLGLYIVKEAVKVLQGEIIVDSELGNGSTFTLKFQNNLVNKKENN